MPASKERGKTRKGINCCNPCRKRGGKREKRERETRKRKRKKKKNRFGIIDEYRETRKRKRKKKKNRFGIIDEYSAPTNPAHRMARS